MKQFIKPILPLWKRKIIRFINRIITVWQFAKLGWKDYWWDYSYIEDILIFKLRQMSKRFHEDGHLEGSHECVKEMEFVADILEELYSLDEKLYAELDAEYNPPSEIFNWVKNETGFYEMLYSSEYESFLKTKKGKEYDKKRSALVHFIPKKKKEMRKKAYGIIADKISNWWD